MTDSQNRPPEPPPEPSNEQNFVDGTNPIMPQPGMAPSLQPNKQDIHDLKRARTLIMVANISAPVSLFIGGMLLSAVGLACGIIGYRKLKRIAVKKTDVGATAERIRRSGVISMAACGLAFGLNAVSFYIMFPIVLEMLESGAYPGLTGVETGASTGSITWG